MRKIITAKQTRQADSFTIDHEPITSFDLMERASTAFVECFSRDVSLSKKVVVLAGTGNNGGDGLAAARLLAELGFDIETVLVRFSDNLSIDCQKNLSHLDEGKVKEIRRSSDLDLAGCEVIIDAIFGSGLNRSVEGFVGEVIQKVNDSELPVFSIDVPSGLMTDKINLKGEVIKAHKTITFQRPKLSFMLPETGEFVNNWEVVDIGLNESFIERQDSAFFFQSLQDIRGLIPQRSKFQHKGDFGRVQVFSGSIGKIGAAFLCSKAVLKVGAGLLTVHLPKVGNVIIQTALPEAMVTLDTEENIISDGRIEDNTGVVCVGPGIDQHQKTKDWLSSMLDKAKAPMVIDADALNLISQMDNGYESIPEGSVITPHVGEFERLFGKHTSSLERLETIKRVTSEQNIVIVLKGAHSVIGLPDGSIVFNTTGNSGMATAGSGDVLSGIITGLIAQGLDFKSAARLGVWLHGEAGDLAQIKFGKMSLMASDLLNEIPKAINNVSLTTFI